MTIPVLPPGRVLDARIAEIMGWRACDPEERYGHWQYGDTGDEFGDAGVGVGTAPGTNIRMPFPNYSTSIGSTWDVVRSRPLGRWSWRMSLEDNGRWFAEVRIGYATSYSKACCHWASTIEHAICLAALEAFHYEQAKAT